MKTWPISDLRARKYPSIHECTEFPCDTAKGAGSSGHLENSSTRLRHSIGSYDRFDGDLFEVS